MLITLITALAISSDAWVHDTALIRWCSQDSISPQQIVRELSVLDSVMAIEQKLAPRFDTHATLRELGERIPAYEKFHRHALPHTEMTADSSCRLYFTYRDKNGHDDTCSDLTASTYLTRSLTDMPMTRLTVCRETGLRTYEFMTEHGKIVIDEQSQSVILYAENRRHFLWTESPLNPYDTIPAEFGHQQTDSVSVPQKTPGSAKP